MCVCVCVCVLATDNKTCIIRRKNLWRTMGSQRDYFFEQAKVFKKLSFSVPLNNKNRGKQTTELLQPKLI